jgi:hypothetical protein
MKTWPRSPVCLTLFAVACGAVACGENESGGRKPLSTGGSGNTQSGGSSSGGSGASSAGGSGAAGGNTGGSAGSPDGGAAPDSELPTIPVGADAYATWDTTLPNLRIGQRAYMRSTYDRAGGNEGADASHFLRQDSESMNVTLDVMGTGVLEFVRTNHWHGSPWHYVVDETDHVVSETSTATPNSPVSGSTFLPEDLFPSPLALTWSTTKGADLNWVPLGFENSFTLGYERTHYGTGYYIYHLFDPSADNLSSPIETWDETPPPTAALDLLNQAGTDIAPMGADVDVTEGSVNVGADETVTLADLDGGPAFVRALRLTATKEQAIALGRATLKVTWDDAAEPSISAPVALFFGAGTLYNRTDAEYLVKALLMNIQFDATNVTLSAYFPMPFFQNAHIEIVGGAEGVSNLGYHVRSAQYDGPSNGVGYFHATYRDHAAPVGGEDLVILDTTETEGGGSFCGSFAGMSWIFSDNSNLGTLEGDPRFFFDDSNSPQAYGTGTEEWGGGGDYWGGQNMTLPLAGHPVGTGGSPVNDEDKIESAYRLLLADIMPFGRNARIQLEHGGNNDSGEHYQSVAYWYGLPGECLKLTDEFHVSDTADETAHAYTSPTATEIDTLTSRYELGPNSPESTDTGRHMTGDTEFTVALDSENQGALIRRKLDYGFPDQKAEVYVASTEDGAEYELAGTWYLAGSNRCVYSNPGGELDAAQHNAQTSNRRWREDEFIIPRNLTRGQSEIRIKLHFVPTSHPLFEGDTVPELAWSEYRYSVYSYVLPPAP